MSRDLSFWKFKVDSKVENKCVYEDLSKEKILNCVDELPIENIIYDFNKSFEKWKIHNNIYFEKNEEYFELMITKQFVRVDCYSMEYSSINRIIDIMSKYNCPLYDSAIDRRFE